MSERAVEAFVPEDVKLVVHHSVSPGFECALEALKPDWLTSEVIRPGGEEQKQAELASADVLLHFLEPVTRELLSHAPNLKLIQKFGAGVNTIDLVGAARRGVEVANMPGVNAQAVAEHTVMLILAVLRRVSPLDRAVRQGNGWDVNPADFDGCGEIHGRRVGLVGLGEIATRVGRILDAFGAEVAYFSRRRRSDVPFEFESLDSLCRRSEILSLHLPLTDETVGILDRRRLELLPSGAVVINTARGQLIDESALADALDSGHLLGAGLDTFQNEPPSSDSPLLESDRVVLTPHSAWVTRETMERGLRVTLENCARLRDGRPLLHTVV